MDKIQKKIKNALSGDDITNALNGKVKVILYSSLSKYKTMEELLGKYKKVVLLYQSSSNFGHWCCLYEYCGTICFFDSYGIVPDDELNYMSKEMNKKLMQDCRWLTHLLYESCKTVQYNEYPLQQLGPEVNTCGRWCIIRLKYTDISIDNFHKLFTSFKDYKPDYLITLVT